MRAIRHLERWNNDFEDIIKKSYFFFKSGRLWILSVIFFSSKLTTHLRLNNWNFAILQCPICNFLKNKTFAKHIFKIFFDFFFENELNFNRLFFQVLKNCQNYCLNFFRIFFFRNFFLRKFFSKNFVWRKFFFSQKYFCEDFFHNIFGNFFCIWCLRNNVFCEIFYSKLCLLRIFLLCNFSVRKKKFYIFFAIFFSDEREYQIWKCFCSEKSQIFSDRTFGFLYSLLGK